MWSLRSSSTEQIDSSVGLGNKQRIIAIALQAYIKDQRRDTVTSIAMFYH